MQLIILKSDNYFYTNLIIVFCMKNYWSTVKPMGVYFTDYRRKFAAY